MRARAVGILFNEQQDVLLMRRRKEGRVYATLPGGGIEEGETPAQACARELLEEVNLEVDVLEEVLTLENQGNQEHYFRVVWRSGEMRLGDGPEGVRHSEQNWYNPEWVSVDDLDGVNLVPAELHPLIRTMLENA
ncbi:DNA mismatch repair protein MutT [Deinococcus malanensis]|uniref:DNA mismatch repair protein MutT n=2 Tax=Deinococcus malanensis TaxID=1706855 RepID=A0ABQ2F130_9DEIO|nr:NUDIX domain-containing protein [Deinococcus malanensis]GGK37401.1 DNA mismatch repair protein MutT [Deinococcus malanensis]